MIEAHNHHRAWKPHLARHVPVLASLAMFACFMTAAADAAFDPTGVWTLKQDNGVRECRLQLRDEPLGSGRAVAMPPGCHRAFPVLNGVRSWVLVDDAHLTLNNDADAALLLFEDDGSGRLHAIGPEGGDSYTMTAVGVRPRPAEDGSGEGKAPAAATVTVPKPSPNFTVTAATVAGHYAVMRGSRDTGCMVTLDEPGKAAASQLKARLAPACRDQGIVIFDPIGWQLKAGHLVLTARKGHSAELERNDDGLWVKEGKPAQQLGLKRL